MRTANPTYDQIAAGQAVYTKPVLRIYDLWVHGISNHLIWDCPTRHLCDFYNQHISSNHLDVGVGTGYFLDQCQFPTAQPRLGLMDMNSNSLQAAAERIARYSPECHETNVLEPIRWLTQRFDTIGLNYLLHCLPGTMAYKGLAIQHLKALLNCHGVIFGSTILQRGVRRSWPARQLMGLYNAKGVFNNAHDDLDGLLRMLNQHLTEVSVEVVGCVALFRGSI